MNTTNYYHTRLSEVSSLPLVSNAILDTIEVELTEAYAPTLIDLNHLFGSAEFQFTAMAVTSGVVEVDAISEPGFLFLSASEKAYPNTRSRIAVRGVDAQGRSVATAFEVLVVCIEEQLRQAV